MLNSKSRLGKDNFIKKVGALVVDESHMISSPGRGDHLEVGLINFIKNNPLSRIVLLSATMPNIEDISGWLKKISNKECFVVNSDYRPCPLKIHYEPYDDSFTGYNQTEQEKINKCLDIIEHYNKDKFLVFVHTKKTGEMLKIALVEAGIDTEFHNANLEKSKKELRAEKKAAEKAEKAAAKEADKADKPEKTTAAQDYAKSVRKLGDLMEPFEVADEKAFAKDFAEALKAENEQLLKGKKNKPADREESE
jgi:replicative superfamily II helicase